jgi:hypothetical protein
VKAMQLLLTGDAEPPPSNAVRWNRYLQSPEGVAFRREIIRKRRRRCDECRMQVGSENFLVPKSGFPSEPEKIPLDSVRLVCADCIGSALERMNADGFDEAVERGRYLRRMFGADWRNEDVVTLDEAWWEEQARREEDS